ATTGAQLWVKRYNGPAGKDDVPTALHVSPVGGGVFVTGQSLGSAPTSQYATVAYDATTGHAPWVARYSGPRNFRFAYALGVRPDGSTVFVTGECSALTNPDYATIAYSAS